MERISIDWQTKTLSEICNLFADGDLIEKKDQSSKGIRLIQTGNIGNGIFKKRIDKSRYISESTFNRLRCTEVMQGDCLISRLPEPVGRACIIPKTNEQMITAVDCTIIRFNSKEILDEWFIYFSLSQEYQKEINQKISGATRQRISRNYLGKIRIPLPPLPEQKRIVSILDEAFAAIEKAKGNAEKNLQNAKELFESYLQSLFLKPSADWQYLTLKEASSMFGRGKSKHRPRNDKKLYGGKYPFIQTSQIRNCKHYIRDYSQTYNETGLAQSKLWPKGTICITIAANIAETGILSFDACFPDSVIGMVVNPKIAEINFVEYLLQSFQSVLKAKGKGSAQDNINLATFEKEKFPFPSLVEQKIFVANLNELSDKTFQLNALYTQKLIALDELKQSLLHKAFRGEL